MNVTKNVDTFIHIHNALSLMERTVGTRVYSVKSFKFVGAKFRGSLVFLLIRGDVISWMCWFSVLITITKLVFVGEDYPRKLSRHKF